MNVRECAQAIEVMFDPKAIRPGELGVSGDLGAVVSRVGYATNLTPETVRLAADYRIDLLVTHHDAWDFVFGMKAACTEALERFGVAHVFAHLPLDAADFGTASALARALGARVVGRCTEYEGFRCGVVAGFERAVELAELVSRVESVCDERVRSWRNNSRPIRRLGVFPGGGVLTSYLHECVQLECDAFLTGERNLYTVQYAAQAGISLIVGSHTYTEFFGVQELVNRLVAGHPEIAAVGIYETHVESAN